MIFLRYVRVMAQRTMPWPRTTYCIASINFGSLSLPIRFTFCDTGHICRRGLEHFGAFRGSNCSSTIGMRS